MNRSALPLTYEGVGPGKRRNRIFGRKKVKNTAQTKQQTQTSAEARTNASSVGMAGHIFQNSSSATTEEAFVACALSDRATYGTPVPWHLRLLLHAPPPSSHHCLQDQKPFVHSPCLYGRSTIVKPYNSNRIILQYENGPYGLEMDIYDSQKECIEKCDFSTFYGRLLQILS